MLVAVDYRSPGQCGLESQSGRGFLPALNPSLAGPFFCGFGGEPNGDHAELQRGLLDAKKFEGLGDSGCLVRAATVPSDCAGVLPKIETRQR